MLDISGKFGTVAPGAFADIIAAKDDPLDDVKILRNVQFVMEAGKVFDA